MPRLIVISDTHLSPVHGFFYKNFARVRDAINAGPADLIVNAGDLAVDGAGREEDLTFAAECHRRLSASVRVIPGNHDIGDTPYDGVRQPINDERIIRYRGAFGQNWWAEDLGTWRLIGLDALIMGSGHADEAVQWDWLAAELAAAKDRPVGLFVHKPLFIETLDEPDAPNISIAREARYRLLDLCAGPLVRFIVSGHLHQSSRQTLNGIELIWMPSTAFESSDPREDCDPRLGYMEFDLTDTEYVANIVRPDGLHPYTIAEVKEHGKYAFIRDMPPSPPDLD